LPILPSAARRIHELLRSLESASPVEHDSAVARLTLLGARILPQLPRFLSRASAAGKLGVLDVLERLAVREGLPLVLGLVRDPSDEVARRAVEAAGAFPDAGAVPALSLALGAGPAARRRAAADSLGRLHALGLVEAVDPLLRTLLATDEDEPLRLAALQALAGVDRRTLGPALRRLASDPSPAVAGAAAARLGRAPSAGRADASAAAAAPVAAGLPSLDSPAWLTQLTSPRTSASQLEALLADLVARRSPAVVPRLRRHLQELDGASRAEGPEGTARAKARVHRALAALGSRLALHDLREMLRARPLYAALDLLAAAERVGDASLVGALAGLAAERPELREAVAAAFRAVARREKLKRTSRVFKGLREAERSAALSLLAATKDAARPAPRGGTR
jgi:hypothetical protein